MNNKNRVVITGLGVVAPNGVGIAEFEQAIKAGKSGIEFIPELEELNFRCTVGGVPKITEDLLAANFTELELKRLSARGVIYGILAGLEAWKDAGLAFAESDAEPNWDYGTVFGAGISGINTLRDAIYRTDDLKVRKLGTTMVEQTMPSAISAFLGGKLGLGNQVTTNASACSTGTESILMAYERIRHSKATIMLAGSCDADSPHVWGGFDAMRVLNYKNNEESEKASRPMAADASGFIPGSGGGALVLESLQSAKARGAKIYGEIAGGFVNSGGQRGGGTMTAPNSMGIQKCIEGALKDASIQPSEIDLISGHLTSTMGDVPEIANWSKALGLSGKDFPKVNSLKSMTGHCLSAAGSIESVACVLQLNGNYIHPSINCEEVHPGILEIIGESCIPKQMVEQENTIIAKSSFGFGDVNSCIIFKKYRA